MFCNRNPGPAGQSCVSFRAAESGILNVPLRASPAPPADTTVSMSHLVVASEPILLRHLAVRGGAIVLTVLGGMTARGDELEPRAAMEHALTPFVSTYCVDCHSGDEAEAGLALDRLMEAPSVPHRRREWQRAVERIAKGEMPPEDAMQPEPAEREQALAWLRAELADPDCSQPQDPGRAVVRRLNRTEYENTVRDLLGVEFDAATIFPRDELAHGFDNNADVQSLPPVLLEKYLQAAEVIATQAISAPESWHEPRQAFLGSTLEGDGDPDGQFRKLFTNGRAWTEVTLPSSGEYLLRARAYADQAGDEPARMRMFVGEQEVLTVDVTSEDGDLQTFVARFQADAGEHQIGVEFLNDHWNPDAKDKTRRDRNLHVFNISVVGPLSESSAADLPESHRRLLAWTPDRQTWQSADAWREPTRELIARLLIRAFRRPPTADEIDRLMTLVAAARERYDSFERAMQLVVQATLVSPQFLFRGEASEPGRPARLSSPKSGPDELNEYELASRLSYFLWSSMPDEALLKLAADGQLRTQLDAQVDRMLNGPRGDALIRNFGEQWLETRRLEGMRRNAELFPEFDKKLRDALREETFLLLSNVIRNNRPLTELLTADYSFVNGVLAKHYGMTEPTGDEFVRVTLPAERRAGILAHGSVLAVTSHEDRTSPVLRGQWVLNHLLADPAPPPPPGVGSLPEATGVHEGQTLRQRLEIHRANPSCAGCHNRMDPLGLAMENFDAVGRWREFDGAAKIDVRGQLPDGQQLDGLASLRDVLLKDYPRVRRCLAENLLTYALGRGLEPSDTCAVNEIVAAAEAGGETFASMVRAIVKSAPFQQRDETK